MGHPADRSLAQLPEVSDMLDGLLVEATDMLALLQQARPGSLDTATLNPDIERYTEQHAMAPMMYAILQWWLNHPERPLTAPERTDIHRLQGMAQQLATIVTAILALTEQLKHQTIEALLGMDDTTVALRYLSRDEQG